jgi:hypothetical protein
VNDVAHAQGMLKRKHCAEPNTGLTGPLHLVCHAGCHARDKRV